MAIKHKLGEGQSPLFAGEDRDLVYTVADGDGVAVDVTGWALSWIGYDSGGSAVVTLTTGAGIALTTPASGIITVSLSAANLTALQAAGAGLAYKLRRTDSGLNTVLAYGDLVVGS